MKIAKVEILELKTDCDVFSAREARQIQGCLNQTFRFFSENGSSFLFTLYKHGGEWRPNWVWHESVGECPFCGLPVGAFPCVCKKLSLRLDELAKSLLRHPSIRLAASLRFKPLGA